MTKSNLVLIGMPGSGKSTIGVLLAKRTSHSFLDTDLLIQSRSHRSLQEIINQDGQDGLKRLEEEVLLDIDVEEHVIATGGSVVYSERGMAHLRRDGLVIFLEVDLPVLEKRLGDFSQRGIAMQPGQRFDALYQERLPLYEKYADLRLDCSDLTHDQVVKRLLALLRAAS